MRTTNENEQILANLGETEQTCQEASWAKPGETGQKTGILRQKRGKTGEKMGKLGQNRAKNRAKPGKKWANDAEPWRNRAKPKVSPNFGLGSPLPGP